MNPSCTQQHSGVAQVEDKIAEIGGWRGAILTHIRELIKQVEPEVSEECKWHKPTNPSGVPVWSYHGIICTGECYKSKVKLTFTKGAFLSDPYTLFNSSLEGKQRRAIDINEGETIDSEAFKGLVYEAIALNNAGKQG